MTSYAGLDVSQQETTVCVVDAAGVVRFSGSCATEPGAIAAMLGVVAPELGRAVLETGALTPWLFHGLTALGVPVICTCARQAHAALSHGPSKTDKTDAEGLARLAQTSWLKPVNVRSLEAHERKTVLVAREALVRAKNRLTNQVRGLLKPFGLLVGKVGAGRFELRVRELAAERPGLMLALEPLLAIRRRTMDEIERVDRRLIEASRDDAVVRQLMTIPGVGHVTAETFTAVIDDPSRFAHSAEVGAYLGLVAKRWQSGQLDQSGRIAKCGDAMLRHLLYECANNILTIVKKPFPLKAWAEQLEARVGGKKARVALARKLAVLMHKLWISGEAFDPDRAMAA